MLQPDVKAISVDDHIIEPPHLWQSRLPERLRATGPRVIELDDGTEAWVFEDQVVQTKRGNARHLPQFDQSPHGLARFSEMRPGCYEPHARLEEMDLDGVWAQVNFPDFCRFAGHRFIGCHDQELARACVSAYNDFLVDEWCAADPARLHAVGIIPFWDVPAAVAEVERIGASGIKAIAFSENPTTLGLPSIYTDTYEPLWAAIAATGLPICLHIGSSSKLLRSAPDAPDPVGLTFVGANSMMACADWLFSGVLERFPSLRIAFSEGGAGWVPYVLERADEVFENLGDVLAATRPPRELFAEHMFTCIMRDDVALGSLDIIGERNVMWEADYPHESGTFPNSRELLEKSLEKVPDEQAAMIAETNARRLFNI
jgi:predicted TIM-barrel fold metal-dependent hydrolase